MTYNTITCRIWKHTWQKNMHYNTWSYTITGKLKYLLCLRRVACTCTHARARLGRGVGVHHEKLLLWPPWLAHQHLLGTVYLWVRKLIMGKEVNVLFARKALRRGGRLVMRKCKHNLRCKILGFERFRLIQLCHDSAVSRAVLETSNHRILYHRSKEWKVGRRLDELAPTARCRKGKGISQPRALNLDLDHPYTSYAACLVPAALP